MSNQTTIIFRESPLLEISFDNTHIHIVDFETEKNNRVIYYDGLKSIGLVKNSILIKSINKEIELVVNINNISNVEKIIDEIKKLKNSKELIYPKTDYRQEPFESFKERYNGYGKELYEVLINQYPNIFEKLKLYQPLDYPEDSFAEYIGSKKSFVIQLDYHSELILINDGKKHFEIGTWGKDQINKSLNFIINEILE